MWIRILRPAVQHPVVDTFGICSFEDEVAVLREMQRVLKPDGQLLLLEHGKSSYGWLSDLLDEYAARHALKWGCVWNKDILGLVEEAGVELTESDRYHLGTSYYIVGKKGQPREPQGAQGTQ